MVMKKVYRRKKTFKKPYRKRNVYVPRRTMRSNALTCTRKVILGTWGALKSQGWLTNPYQFRLDGISSYSEFQSLFDSYRINAVKLTFTPFWDSSDVTQTSAPYTGLPRVYTIIDRNGIPLNSINTEAKILEYSKSRVIKKPQEPFSIYIKYPGVEMSSAGDLASSPAVFKARPWIDTSNATIPHNGCAIGMVCPVGSDTSGWYYHVVATYYLQFRTVV